MEDKTIPDSAITANYEVSGENMFLFNIHNLRYYARPDYSIWSKTHVLLCRQTYRSASRYGRTTTFNDKKLLQFIWMMSYFSLHD